MSEAPQVALDAWASEGVLVDETEFTKSARAGWSSWNNMSPELEFCGTAAQLVRMIRPARLLETGVGQGYVTRRVVAAMTDDAELRCFESDEQLAASLGELPFFAADSRLTVCAGRPSIDDLGWAEFTMLDSLFAHRRKELETWCEVAPAGSYVMVHDTGSDHQIWTPHQKLKTLIDDLGIPGVFLPNPRGSFFGQKR